MIFGEEKGRQMARSILPSQWRGAASAKARVRRKSRHRARAVVAALVRDPYEWDDGDDLDDDATHETRMWVRRRRGSDKLNHFERWATEVTRALPREDRVGWIKAVLPAGLIGEHAVTHLVRWDAFESDHEKRMDAAARSRWKRAPRSFLDRGEHAALLRRILITDDAHRRLNRALETVVQIADHQSPLRRASGSAPRKLLGAFDVLPFLDALQLRANHPLKVAMDAFCRTFKATEGRRRSSLPSP